MHATPTINKTLAIKRSEALHHCLATSYNDQLSLMDPIAHPFIRIPPITLPPLAVGKRKLAHKMLGATLGVFAPSAAFAWRMTSDTSKRVHDVITKNKNQFIVKTHAFHEKINEIENLQHDSAAKGVVNDALVCIEEYKTRKAALPRTKRNNFFSASKKLTKPTQEVSNGRSKEGISTQS